MVTSDFPSSLYKGSSPFGRSATIGSRVSGLDIAHCVLAGPSNDGTTVASQRV